MANFEQAYQKTSANEGGYSNSKYDTGGETWKGVSRVKHPAWPGWALVDKHKATAQDIKSLNAALYADQELEKLVRLFYMAGFWDSLSLGACTSQKIAEALYDWAVNSGPGAPGKPLQILLNRLNKKQSEWKNIPEDGAVGPNTINTLNAAIKKDPRYETAILNGLKALRDAFLIQITPEDSNNEMNLLGWLLRVG